MKKSILAACVVLILSAVPADAQVVRRPLFPRLFGNPVVQQFINAGISQFLPALGSILTDASKATDTKIYVDSSVTTNLSATATNLKDTNDILQKMLKNSRNGINTGSAAPTGGGTAPAGKRIVDATKEELLEALKSK